MCTCSWIFTLYVNWHLLMQTRDGQVTWTLHACHWQPPSFTPRLVFTHSSKWKTASWYFLWALYFMLFNRHCHRDCAVFQSKYTLTKYLCSDQKENVKWFLECKKKAEDFCNFSKTWDKLEKLGQIFQVAILHPGHQQPKMIHA